MYKVFYGEGPHDNSREFCKQFKTFKEAIIFWKKIRKRRNYNHLGIKLCSEKELAIFYELTKDT